MEECHWEREGRRERRQGDEGREGKGRGKRTIPQKAIKPSGCHSGQEPWQRKLFGNPSFFFNLRDLLNAVDRSQLFLLRLINVRFHEALRNKNNSFTLCLFFTSPAEGFLPYKHLWTCTTLISLHFKHKPSQWKTNVRGTWLQAKPWLEECPVRKICQELKEKYTYKIITDDSGLVLWWRQRCMALCEKTGNMPKLLLQEGNLSKPGCSGIPNTTGEIRESDSACNYC